MAPEAGSCQLPKRVTVVENKGGGGQSVQLALKTKVEVAKACNCRRKRWRRLPNYCR